MSRLTAKIVRSGLVTAWRLAGWPTSRSPSSVNATMDGVVRIPSAFSMTLGVLPSITATQEFVVPKSMPITLAMVLTLSFTAGRAGPKGTLCPTPLSSPGPFPSDTLAHIGEHDRAASQFLASSESTVTLGHTDEGMSERMKAPTGFSGLRIYPEYLDRNAQIEWLAAVRDVFAAAPLYTPRMPKSGR